MSTKEANNGLILYHYVFSPFARKVTSYLALRGIDYAQCLQPVMLPRPDINALGVAYRRIPVMAIGSDVYCDTRLIIQKLEKLFPDGALGATEPEGKALELLLGKWTGNEVFTRAGQSLPSGLPLLKDPKFQADRNEYSGQSWDKKAREAMRPEALVHIREGFSLLETTLLADGRDWILKTEKPSLADIEAIWPLHWLAGTKGALPEDIFSPEQFPRVFDWIKRYDHAVKNARGAAPKPTTLKGEAALDRITKAASRSSVSVQSKDPYRLSKGQVVEIWPLDTGFSHKDRGELEGLNEEEIVLRVRTKHGDDTILLHVPRTGYRLRAVKGESSARL